MLLKNKIARDFPREWLTEFMIPGVPYSYPCTFVVIPSKHVTEMSVCLQYMADPMATLMWKWEIEKGKQGNFMSPLDPVTRDCIKWLAQDLTEFHVKPRRNANKKFWTQDFIKHGNLWVNPEVVYIALGAIYNHWKASCPKGYFERMWSATRPDCILRYPWVKALLGFKTTTDHHAWLRGMQEPQLGKACLKERRMRPDYKPIVPPAPKKKVEPTAPPKDWRESFAKDYDGFSFKPIEPPTEAPDYTGILFASHQPEETVVEEIPLNTRCTRDEQGSDFIEVPEIITGSEVVPPVIAKCPTCNHKAHKRACVICGCAG